MINIKSITEKVRSGHVREQYVRYQCDIQSVWGRINKKNERKKDESRKAPERIVRITMDNSPPEWTDTSRSHKKVASHSGVNRPLVWH
jgi:hypothetical protein